MKVAGIILKFTLSISYLVVAATAESIAMSLLCAALAVMTGIMAIDELLSLIWEKKE